MAVFTTMLVLYGSYFGVALQLVFIVESVKLVSVTPNNTQFDPHNYTSSYSYMVCSIPSITKYIYDDR